MKSLICGILLVFIHLEFKCQETNWKHEINPFYQISNNAINSLSGTNAIIQLASIFTTYGIISTKLDYKIHNYFYENKDQYNSSSIPAVYVGYLVPISLGGSLYAVGLWKDNPKLAAAGCAVLQASFLAWTETSLLKAFTGRKNPDNFIYKKTNDASKKFQFGFLNNGIHYGWPSGHMAVSTALLTSLASFYLDNSYIQAISWIAWFYMFYGVTVHEGNTMHWFSDIVAGSLMGFTIGSSVGKNYRKSFQKIKESSNWQYNAFINTNNIGLKLSFQF